jgi:hypothetical protein
MATDQDLTPQQLDRTLEVVRRHRCSFEEAQRLARYARRPPRDDDDDEPRRTKPLRLEDEDDDDQADDREPRPRVVKEPPVVRRPRDADVEDEDDDRDTGRGADEDRRGSRRARPKPQRRRPELDAMLERVTAQPCASCGKTPAGSAEVKIPDEDEREDLDPDKGAYLIPLCPDCKNSPDGQEAAEVEVHKRHARENGDCNKYSRSVRLFNEARDRRDR